MRRPSTNNNKPNSKINKVLNILETSTIEPYDNVSDDDAFDTRLVGHELTSAKSEYTNTDLHTNRNQCIQQIIRQQHVISKHLRASTAPPIYDNVENALRVCIGLLIAILIVILATFGLIVYYVFKRV